MMAFAPPIIVAAGRGGGPVPTEFAIGFPIFLLLLAAGVYFSVSWLLR